MPAHDVSTSGLGVMHDVAVWYHERFLEHDTGYHPENAERLRAARRSLLAEFPGLTWRTPAPAPLEAITRVHDATYVDTVRSMSVRGGGSLDLDTVVSPASYDAALLAAGAGIQAIDQALATGERGFLLVRPPGHHATPVRGMGFCLFNNIAVAALHALEERGLRRVLIVDWDVHHGNGTQDTFYADPRVLFVSMHMSPHYPGTGALDEVGVGRAAGCTVNVPLGGGCGDGAVAQVFALLVDPLARAFRPELILASSGYDAQAGDPLGGLAFSQSAFQWMAWELGRLAEAVGAAGPICFLEGGYDPERLGRSVVATVKGLTGEPVAFAPVAAPVEVGAVAAALRVQAPYWGADLLPR